jgi:putative transposase
MSSLSSVVDFVLTVFDVIVDLLTLFYLSFRSISELAAENLFLRKQLGLYVEQKKKPRRATDSARFTLALLARLFEWRSALIIVKPDTLIRWHRKGFRLFWKWKSRSLGRPRIPDDLQHLIVEIATKNPTPGYFIADAGTADIEDTLSVPASQCVL